MRNSTKRKQAFRLGAIAAAATIFGYPANLDDGDRMQRCRTLVRKKDRPNSSIARGCRYGKGSSGGRWVWQYRTGTGLGFARGVTSYGPSRGVADIGSPHFDRAVRDLARAANRAF
ncbi:hypothetical protein [Myceligenerans pegani]|uniref:Uncharacterized protein n=1 Tax=Myceligenerans pegani TaxID=2776917 RepID=A0ABR9MWC5_9MICO|nr:hypothetical protein [Myceligenerans sp. TRM 65318]MBE1875685.1 hypothetical protein [Myceligenerans sp. TRM 65318]MBE3017956.1 hypothetical protein [Myceligenerans sp. TRM 65318]